MSVLLIAGSPSERSRAAALLNATGRKLTLSGAKVNTLRVRDLNPQAVLLADFEHPSIVQTVARVAAASIIVIATPVYKAAYSGILKSFLDLLPQSALKGKTVLPLATGGSPHHMLALDYALRPVLQSLGAKNILSGIYATDAQVILNPEDSYQIAEDVDARLDEAVATLVEENLWPILTKEKRFSPVHFSQIRCSV